MKKQILIFLSIALFSCGENSQGNLNAVEEPLILTQQDVLLVDVNDGLGIPNVTYNQKPFTGIIKDFQGYYVADYLKDSLQYNNGFSYYTDGKLDSVIVPYLQEKRYFNGDNSIDSISVLIDGETRILYFEDELLIRSSNITFSY